LASLFEVLDAEQIGVELTENFAMLPASSVSGFYLAHPQARYFNVGPIGCDQLEYLARRREVAASELERWLASNLS
jgi:5-methyltetrahydrofolate--homocysteine methyltransferase